MKTLTTLLVGALMVGCSNCNYGEVINKSYRPAHTQMILKPVGKVLIPSPVIIQEGWSITITDSGKTNTCNVSKEVFDSVKLGEWFKCI